MSDFKFAASIIGFTVLVSLAMASISWVKYLVGGNLVPWQIHVALFPAAVLLGLTITVMIDKPLGRR
ncbi:MAG: hypothetical protein K0U84_07650 [Actinomycetia bacterium]|nr:hypothetical protein [Actinomycetes bacterium]